MPIWGKEYATPEIIALLDYLNRIRKNNAVDRRHLYGAAEPVDRCPVYGKQRPTARGGERIPARQTTSEL
jgi:hypothetical protein